jgi:predicted nuclease of predicted toxin-antitoxin system
MKFLVDVCAGNRLANWLRDHGYDVLEVRDREPTMADEEILHWANVEKRVIVTMDKDFGTLAVALNQPHNHFVSGSYVQIRLYADRLEVQSPGG